MKDELISALCAANCLSPDGTFIHAATETVLMAVIAVAEADKTAVMEDMRERAAKLAETSKGYPTALSEAIRALRLFND